MNVLSKSVAASTLQELGDKLQLLARYETGFPQALVNVAAVARESSLRGLITANGTRRYWHTKGEIQEKPSLRGG